MLSFRVNRAMQRWWEGRRAFADLQAESHNFVAASNVYILRRDVAAQVAMQSYATVKATEYALRRVDHAVQLQELARITNTDAEQMPPAIRVGDGDEGGSVSEVQRPLQLTATLSAQLAEAFDRGTVFACVSDVCVCVCVCVCGVLEESSLHFIPCDVALSSIMCATTRGWCVVALTMVWNAHPCVGGRLCEKRAKPRGIAGHRQRPRTAHTATLGDPNHNRARHISKAPALYRNDLARVSSVDPRPRVGVVGHSRVGCHRVRRVQARERGGDTPEPIRSPQLGHPDLPAERRVQARCPIDAFTLPEFGDGAYPRCGQGGSTPTLIINISTSTRPRRLLGTSTSRGFDLLSWLTGKGSFDVVRALVRKVSLALAELIEPRATLDGRPLPLSASTISPLKMDDIPCMHDGPLVGVLYFPGHVVTFMRTMGGRVLH